MRLDGTGVTLTKQACACCDCIVQVPAPSRPILRGVAGPGWLAHILVSKFASHQPLYRQSAIYARQGVEADRSSMGRRVGACSALMAPQVDALRTHVMAGAKLHADDTPVPVLAAGNGQTKTDRLWTYVRDDRNAASNVAPAVWLLTRQIARASIRRWRHQDFAAEYTAEAGNPLVDYDIHPAVKILLGQPLVQKSGTFHI